MKPSLELSQWTLRPAVPSDLDGLCHLLWQPAVRRYLCDDILLPAEQVRGFVEDSDRLDEAGLGLWVLEASVVCFSRPVTGPSAGLISLRPCTGALAAHDATCDAVEVVVALREGLWGRGLANAMLAHLRSYAGVTLGLTRWVAAADEPNTRSKAMLRRCGFLEVGRAPGPAHMNILYEQKLTGRT